LLKQFSAFSAALREIWAVHGEQLPISRRQRIGRIGRISHLPPGLSAHIFQRAHNHHFFSATLRTLRLCEKQWQAMGNSFKQASFIQNNQF